MWVNYDAWLVKAVAALACLQCNPARLLHKNVFSFFVNAAMHHQLTLMFCLLNDLANRHANEACI